MDTVQLPRLHERLALAGLLAGTALVYLWNISINGWANQFYAAAVQAGSQSWSAWFFGSLDPQNFITVDKPPASLWLMGLSGRIFGFSSASMLAPEALLAVGTAALLYFAVRRVSGHGAGLIAGAVFALTPAAAVIFRYNNPDALMVFLMVLGGYFLLRAVEAVGGRASAWWLVGCGTALGFAFLAKMLEGLIVLPAFALAYLVAAHGSWTARLGRLMAGAGALVAASGWWVLAVALTPDQVRPYVGGSTDDTEIDLILGYNGLQRVIGGGKQHGGGGGHDFMPGGQGGHGGMHAMSQGPGIARLFQGDLASQIDWLLPTALLALVIGLLLCGRAARTDLVRAAHLLWGGWLLTGFFLFSFMNHGMHTYYVVALAPAVAAVIATTLRQLWQRRDEQLGRAGLATLALSSGLTAWFLLGRAPDWLPALRWAILAGTAAAVVLLLLPRAARSTRLSLAAAALALLVSLAGAASYVLATVDSPKTGGSPSAGPNLGPADQGGGWNKSFDVSPELAAMLRGAGTQWAAAVVRSSPAASVELAADVPVIAVGGFGGSDPAPTLDEFVGLVKGGKVHYFLDQVPAKNDQAGKPGRQNDRNQPSAQIEAWAKAHTPAPSVLGGVEVYDLSKSS
ncbi:MAG: ArnT family glycosyltransferase [Segniliparus sp.]|uniref:ArnT family glycosyltransferase n=1 Tax=Segniliparus sp. TaxID=2804064 RepID=UPI003F30EA67